MVDRGSGWIRFAHSRCFIRKNEHGLSAWSAFGVALGAVRAYAYEVRLTQVYHRARHAPLVPPVGLSLPLSSAGGLAVAFLASFYCRIMENNQPSFKSPDRLRIGSRYTALFIPVLGKETTRRFNGVVETRYPPSALKAAVHELLGDGVQPLYTTPIRRN